MIKVIKQVLLSARQEGKTQAYREGFGTVMIAFYVDHKSLNEIRSQLNGMCEGPLGAGCEAAFCKILAANYYETEYLKFTEQELANENMS